MRKKIDAGIDRVLSIDSNPLPTYFYYEVVDYDYVLDAHNHPQLDDQDRPFVRACSFKRHTLPTYLEGPTKLLKIMDDKQEAERIHSQVKNGRRVISTRHVFFQHVVV